MFTNLMWSITHWDYRRIYEMNIFVELADNELLSCSQVVRPIAGRVGVLGLVIPLLRACEAVRRFRCSPRLYWEGVLISIVVVIDPLYCRVWCCLVWLWIVLPALVSLTMQKLMQTSRQYWIVLKILEMKRILVTLSRKEILWELQAEKSYLEYGCAVLWFLLQSQRIPHSPLPNDLASRRTRRRLTLRSRQCVP